MLNRSPGNVAVTIAADVADIASLPNTVRVFCPRVTCYSSSQIWRSPGYIYRGYSAMIVALLDQRVWNVWRVRNVVVATGRCTSGSGCSRIRKRIVIFKWSGISESATMLQPMSRLTRGWLLPLRCWLCLGRYRRRMARVWYRRFNQGPIRLG